MHVVRCFQGGDVVHVSGSVNPIRDIGIIETELMLADLETLDRRKQRTGKESPCRAIRKRRLSWPSCRS